MGSTRFYNEFIEQMRREGIAPWNASQMPEAREAHERDEQADRDENRTKREWKTERDFFQSTDEFRAAMADPAYSQNPWYRQKVHDMLSRSAPEIGAHNAPAEPDPKETMLAVARKDAAIATYKKLSVEAAHDPVKRLELLELMHSKDEGVQAWLNEGMGAVANEGPGQKMMRLAGSGSFGPDLSKAMSEGSDATDTEKKGEGEQQ